MCGSRTLTPVSSWPGNKKAECSVASLRILSIEAFQRGTSQVIGVPTAGGPYVSCVYMASSKEHRAGVVQMQQHARCTGRVPRQAHNLNTLQDLLVAVEESRLLVEDEMPILTVEEVLRGLDLGNVLELVLVEEHGGPGLLEQTQATRVIRM